jgi:hypothetical protein
VNLDGGRRQSRRLGRSDPVGIGRADRRATRPLRSAMELARARLTPGRGGRRAPRGGARPRRTRLSPTIRPLRRFLGLTPQVPAQEREHLQHAEGQQADCRRHLPLPVSHCRSERPGHPDARSGRRPVHTIAHLEDRPPSHEADPGDQPLHDARFRVGRAPAEPRPQQDVDATRRGDQGEGAQPGAVGRSFALPGDREGEHDRSQELAEDRAEVGEVEVHGRGRPGGGGALREKRSIGRRQLPAAIRGPTARSAGRSGGGG